MQRSVVAALLVALVAPGGCFAPPRRSPRISGVKAVTREKTWSNPEGKTLREFQENVWMAERPFVWNTIDVGGRSVIARLPSGGLWVHSPIELDEDLQAELEKLGPVKYIVSPNYEHVKWATQWIEAYPEAKSFVCPDGKAKFPDIPFDEELPKDTAKAAALFEDAVEMVWFDCEVNPLTRTPFFNEVSFLLKEAQALVITDVWWNWPSIDDYPGLPTSTRLWRFGMDQVFLPVYKAAMVTDQDRLQQRVAEVLAWDFRTIIPCHGFLVDEAPKERFRSFYP